MSIFGKNLAFHLSGELNIDIEKITEALNSFEKPEEKVKVSKEVPSKEVLNKASKKTKAPEEPEKKTKGASTKKDEVKDVKKEPVKKEPVKKKEVKKEAAKDVKDVKKPLTDKESKKQKAVETVKKLIEKNTGAKTLNFESVVSKNKGKIWVDSESGVVADRETKKIIGSYDESTKNFSPTISQEKIKWLESLNHIIDEKVNANDDDDDSSASELVSDSDSD